MHERSTIFIIIGVYVLMAIYGINRDDIDHFIREVAAALLGPY